MSHTTKPNHVWALTSQQAATSLAYFLSLGRLLKKFSRSSEDIYMVEMWLSTQQLMFSSDSVALFGKCAFLAGIWGFIWDFSGVSVWCVSLSSIFSFLVLSCSLALGCSSNSRTQLVFLFSGSRGEMLSIFHHYVIKSHNKLWLMTQNVKASFSGSFGEIVTSVKKTTPTTFKLWSNSYSSFNK